MKGAWGAWGKQGAANAAGVDGRVVVCVVSMATQRSSAAPALPPTPVARLTPTPHQKTQDGAHMERTGPRATRRWPYHPQHPKRRVDCAAAHPSIHPRFLFCSVL